jgi:hypothetical protein
MDAKELAQRLAEADRQIVALRKATLELTAAGREILEQRNEHQTNNVDRPERSGGGPDRRVPGA